ncbi:MAG TPA: hypothetical protein VGP63_01605 [Planctomycetaceae bacterium]|jgi:hypothetical protein|nr:hypothetical protein [Planctomycetaceae bacterium]
MDPILIFWCINASLALAFWIWVYLSVWRIQNALSEQIDVGREQIQLQRETNRLLRELNSRSSERHQISP